MAKYRLKPNYSFINIGGKKSDARVVDDSDPMFDKQRWKFESEPIDGEAELQKIDLASKVPPDYKTMGRDNLLEVWGSLGLDEPPEDITNSGLRKGIEDELQRQKTGVHTKQPEPDPASDPEQEPESPDEQEPETEETYQGD